MIKAKLTEKQIENSVLSWFKFKNIFAFKVRSTGTFDPKINRFRAHGAWFIRGCPDVLCVYRGVFIGVEVKTSTGRLSVHQKLFHQQVKENGGHVFVVRDVTELAPIFEELDRKLGIDRDSQLEKREA